MSTETSDAATKEALQYWGGYMFNSDKSETDMLDRLLTGIWQFIGSTYEPTDCPDTLPSQLAAFYRAVGADYDRLFIETPHASIQFIYRALGALHSLQPASSESKYADPSVPALKRKGFITWQKIQILLGPEEHVPIIQAAVSKFEIIDPATGQPFMKLVPKQAFPDKPDEEMVLWYEKVSQRLRMEAAAPENQGGRAARASSDFSEDSSDTERGAEEYFRNPMYRDGSGRPRIIRTYSKRPARSPREFIQEGTQAVKQGVRHLWNPQGRRQSLPEKYVVEDAGYEDNRTPTAARPQRFHYKHPPPPPPRRQDSSSSTDSERENIRSSRPLRHQRSHEIPPSPRDYFPPYYEQPRRYSTDTRATQAASAAAAAASDELLSSSKRQEAGFVPSREPLFATKVSQMQQPYERPAVMARGSYSRPSTNRYSVHSVSPRESATTFIREQPDRYDYHSGSSGSRSRSRRSSRETGKDRDRDRDWDRNRERERERGRGREERVRDGEVERDRPKLYRHMPPVDGVNGRRYPVEPPSWR